MTLHDELEDLADDVGEVGFYDSDPEPIGDMTALDKSLAARARLVHELEEAEMVVEARVREFTDWLKERKSELEPRIEWHNRQLEYSHRQILADDPKRTTIILPSGTLSSRAGSMSIQVDEHEYVPWAREQGLVTTVTRRESWVASKTGIKELEAFGIVEHDAAGEAGGFVVRQLVDEETGEVIRPEVPVPGVKWVHPARTFKIS